jgi:class 3 adenylate cyclase
MASTNPQRSTTPPAPPRSDRGWNPIARTLALPPHHPARLVVGSLLVAVIAWALSWAAVDWARGDDGQTAFDEVMYDGVYHLRPERDMKDAEAVILAVSGKDLTKMANPPPDPDADPEGQFAKLGFPWPREVWGDITRYLVDNGAAAVVFDVTFSEPSVYNRAGPIVPAVRDNRLGWIDRAEVRPRDDDLLSRRWAEVIELTTPPGEKDPAVPVVVAAQSTRPSEGDPELIQPVPLILAGSLHKVRTGLVSIKGLEPGGLLRSYTPSILSYGAQLNALATEVFSRLNGRQLAGGRRVGLPPAWSNARFRLDFYGRSTWKVPVKDQEPVDEFTLRHLSAFEIARAGIQARGLREVNVARASNGFPLIQLPPLALTDDAQPDNFRGKVVFIGYTAAGTFDVFSSPISPIMPGVHLHATAFLNMLRDERIAVRSTAALGWFSAGIALLVALGSVASRRGSVKLLYNLAGLLLIGVVCVVEFIGPSPVWWGPSQPLAALAFAGIGGFVRSYIVEDRRRRQMARALGQYLSPEVAADIDRRPAALALAAQERPMTAMFTDLAGFTSFSEAAPVELLTEVLGRYMTRMSAVVFEHGGTIDKFIGDAIMVFWNAPLDQPDHADRACRTALAVRAAESQLRDELLNDPAVAAMLERCGPDAAATVRAMGDTALYTRIGVHTGPMNVGNWGSERKFQYTVIGDAVNSAARLEPANKRYHTRILISGATLALLRSPFTVRKVDVTRVKGKSEPFSIYELLHQGPPTPEEKADLDRYDAAFTLYQRSHFSEARAALEALLRESPTHANGPAAALLERVIHYQSDPPGANWDGVYDAQEK